MEKLTKEQYKTGWKNEVSKVVYGPMADIYTHKHLCNKMRDSISKLCGEIDEAADILEKEGAFVNKDD